MVTCHSLHLPKPDHRRKRTVEPHGMTGDELGRLYGAVRFMELYCSRRCCLWIANLNKGATRDVAAEAWKRITKQQHQQRHYSVLVFEPDDAGLHAHIIYLGNTEIAAHLRKSRVF